MVFIDDFFTSKIPKVPSMLISFPSKIALASTAGTYWKSISKS